MKKLPSIHTVSLRNTIRAGSLLILLLIGITLILFAFLSNRNPHDKLGYAVDVTDDNRDMLVYVSEDGHLMLYDPLNRTETTLLENVSSFAPSRDGRVAFTRPDKDDLALYVFDPANPALAPINITQSPAVRSYPKAWSPDGRYLVFVSYQEGDDDSLYVWDGETTTNIMPDDGLDTVERLYAAWDAEWSGWSHDGRLAFAVRHGRSNPEIYVWDGSTTTNLSQNPEDWDGAISWSGDGKLMFALQGDEGGIYVWDGVSFKNGSPDADTFIRVAPELGPRYARWMDDGFVGFTMYPDSSSSGTTEILLWDLEREAIVKQFPVSSENADSWLAEGGQVILSSHLASGTPTYYLDVENTEGQILFSTETGEFAWSPDGYLAYCILDEDRGWILSLWDGQESWDVARVSYRPVQWKNGGNIFSCNNG
jgi:WD40 repeat protein